MSSFLVFGVRGDDNRCLTKIGKLLYPAHTNATARVPEPATHTALANRENAALSVRAGQSLYKSDFHAKIVAVGKYDR